MAWPRRRRYPPYDPRYDPRYGDPYGRGGYGPGYGYGYRPGGSSCLRDACLLETGCCLAESLDGNCLVAAVLLVPQFAAALRAPVVASRRARSAGPSARLVAAVRVYQRGISARRGNPVCRFTPSCSAYAVEALERHGAARGTWLAARRLLRCRPGGRRGADPVPA